MKKILFFAAAAVAMLTGCSQNDDLTASVVQQNENSNAIQFGTYMGRQAQTRAGATGVIVNPNAATGNKLGKTGYEFGVIAFNHADVWATAKTTATPNFMYNQKVSSSDNGATWTYEPLKYWPNGEDGNNNPNSPSNTATQTAAQYLSFFAYAPYVANAIDPVTDGIIAINGTAAKNASGLGNEKTGEPTVDYKLKANNFTVSGNVDLLWGTRNVSQYQQADGTDTEHNAAGTVYYNTDLTKQKVNEKVSFLFKHALAKVGGSNGLKIVADIDGNGEGEGGYGALDGKTCITVRSISIMNKANATQTVGGTFNLATGAWSNPTNADIAVGALLNENIQAGADDSNAATTDIKMNTEIYNATGAPTYATGTWTPRGVTTTAKNVYNAKDAGDNDYTNEGFYMIPAGENKPLELTVTINYDITTYDEQIKGNYVKINQTITNDVTLDNLTPNKYYKLILHLGLTSVKFTASVADWENADAESAEEVWLPSNVVAQSTSVSLAAGQGATVNTAAATTSYAINLTGLKASTNVTSVEYSGVATAASQTTATDGDGKGVITVTLPANVATDATKSSTVTIKGKDSSDNDFTTVVTIIQAKA